MMSVKFKTMLKAYFKKYSKKNALSLSHTHILWVYSIETLSIKTPTQQENKNSCEQENQKVILEPVRFQTCWFLFFFNLFIYLFW